MCGRPLSTISIGIVTCFSTSSGRAAGIKRDHVDLDVGDVRESLDGQIMKGGPAAPDEQEHHQHHEQRLMQGEATTRLIMSKTRGQRAGGGAAQLSF